MNPCQPSTTSVHLTSIRLKWHLVWIRHDRKFDTANCDEDISLLYKLFYRLFYTIGGWAQIAYSRQLQGDRVGVLYPPVFDPADWEVTEVIRLDTPEGRALIARALAAGGYTVARSLGWVGGQPEMER